jgi:hypothetical protein
MFDATVTLSVLEANPMPIKIMNADAARQAYAGMRTSPITQTPEFEELRIKLGDGLKRNEAVVIELPFDKAKPHARASMKRAAIKLIKKLRLSYSVRGVRQGDTDVLLIVNEEPVVTTPIRKAR